MGQVTFAVWLSAGGEDPARADARVALFRGRAHANARFVQKGPGERARGGVVVPVSMRMDDFGVHPAFGPITSMAWPRPVRTP
jgi:hypothetical protein